MNPQIKFGSLTSQPGLNRYTFDFKDLSVEDLDLNEDGLISDDELSLSELLTSDKVEVDMLDLSSMNADADQNVTEEQYVLWQQIEEMDNYVNTLKEQAAKDLAGADSEDIKKFADKLADFEAEFKNNYMAGKSNDISKMAKDFIEVMPEKYKEIKNDVMSNTKSAVKSRTISNVVKKFMQEDGANGSSFAKKVDKTSITLSSNAQRLLNKVLSSEADRFTKAYNGSNYEKDLTDYLTNYLKTSDKDKLAEAIGIWDKEIEVPESSAKDQERFLQFKKKARNLFITALENNIFIKLGDITVRSESLIMPAIAQFRDADSLRWAVNKAINELSRKTKIQEIAEIDNEQPQNDVSQVNNFAQQNEFKVSNDEDVNFFQ